jgi:hypothetical protein
MRAPAMGLSLLALVSAGTSVDVQCIGAGCGAELIAVGWTKIAECGGHQWSYLLQKGRNIVICTGIAAYGGYVELPCQAFEEDIAQYRPKRACTP